MAYLTTLKDKKIGVLGLGVSGLACLSFLLKNQLTPFVMDANLASAGVKHAKEQWPKLLISELATQGTEGFVTSALADADLLIISPGIALSTPLLQKACKNGCEIIGDIELFARVNRKPVIAISGSNGKSTVTKLVTLLLQNGGYNALYGGNIGVPVMGLLAQPFDIAVLELSSFQLETTQSLHAQTATILNISEDHMDRYDSFGAYVAAKQRIYHHADIAVYNASDKYCVPASNHPLQIAFDVTAPKASFDEEVQQIDVGIADGHFATLSPGGASRLCPLDSLRIVGKHNVQNALAAIALVAPFKLSKDVLLKTFKQFAGLPHRCERVEGTADVMWINDSKATNVGATVAALNGIKPQLTGKLILLAGGVGKSADFAPLQAALIEHVDYLITFGRDSQQIADLFEQAISVNSMAEAVLKAFTLAASGDCVLLSPACASFDMYSNFETRGMDFMALAQEVYHVD